MSKMRCHTEPPVAAAPSQVTHASKVALVRLQQHLHARGFRLFDTQMLTPVTELMGAHVISRDQYLERLRAALAIRAEF